MVPDNDIIAAMCCSELCLNCNESLASGVQLWSTASAKCLDVGSLSHCGGRWIPAVLEQRFQYSFFVCGPDLLLVGHLAHHLLCDAGEGLLLAVKYCYTLTRGNIAKGF